MRINGGKYRGKTLFSPQTGAVRPTSDRMREAVFNILRSRLGFDFSGKVFFDMFAGSGAVGLEALSQGFAKVYFFDKDTAPVLKNAKLFANETAKINIVKGDVLSISAVSDKADVVFTDAPYLQNLTEPLLARIGSAEFLRNGAMCLIEVAKDEACNLPNKFTLIDERKYGAARLLIAEFRA